MEGSSHAVRAVVGEYRLRPGWGTLIAGVVLASSLTAVVVATDVWVTSFETLALLYVWALVVLDVFRAVRRPVETVITTDGLRLRRWRRWREVPWGDVVRIDPDEAVRLIDPKRHRVRVTRRSGRSVPVKGLTPRTAEILVAATRGRPPQDAGVRA